MDPQDCATADSTTNMPPRPRRRIPVSVRMFGVMLVLGCVGSVLWFGIPAWRQGVAIREIERLGGQAYQDSIGPKWLRTVVGEEQMALFDPVDYVRYPPDEATFERRFFPTLSHVNPPYVNGPTVDDVTIECIVGIPNLKRLDLHWTNVSDAGMRRVASLGNLRELSLDGTDVSDASGKFLARMTKLERLSLVRTRMSETGVMQLKPLHKLKRLDVDWNLITPATLKCLSELQGLKYVFIRSSEEQRQNKAAQEAVRRALPRVQVGFPFTVSRYSK